MERSQRQAELAQARKVDAYCNDFEARWRTGQRPRLEDALASAPPALHADILRALLPVEIELLAAEGKQPVEAAYRGRFAAHEAIVGEVFSALPPRHAATATTSASAQGVSGATASCDTSVSRSSVHEQRAGNPPTGEYAAGQQGEAAPLPQRIGRFEVLAILGEGAFGKVYRAHDPKLDRQVAVKVPLPGVLGTQRDRDRFLREAQAAATIRHANICPVYEVGQEGDAPYIVMAYVPGQSLAAMLKSRKTPMAPRQAALIVRKLALALATAHAKGVIHRDLKPGNILYDADRKDLVITDFGLARRIRTDQAQITQSGVVMGTPAYMAPEQARADSKALGPAADVFSLGVILYELLTLQRPFTGSVAEVLGQVLHVDPDPPSKHRTGLDPALETICLKALAKDPAQRHASMKQFAGALNEYLRATPAAVASPAAGSTGAVSELVKELSHEHRAETAAAVHEAVQRARTPLWLTLAGSGVMGVLVLLGILFFVRSGPATIIIQVPLPEGISLKDTTLAFFLDRNPISAEELEKPIELKPGEHELVINRAGKLLRRLLFTVALRGSEVAVAVKRVDAPAQAPAPFPGALVFEQPLSRSDTLEHFFSYPGGGVVVVPGTGLRLGGGNNLSIAWPRPYLGTQYRVQFEVALKEAAWAGFLLQGPGYGNNTDTGYWCRFDEKNILFERAGARAQNAPLATPLRAGAWVVVEADVKGADIEIKLNGASVVQFHDEEPLAGPLHGWFGISSNAADFRNLRLWTLASDTSREPQLTPPATEPARGNGALLYELNLAGAAAPGPEWWMSFPKTVSVESGTLAVSSTGNTPTALVLTRPLSRDLACDVDFEYPTPRALSFTVMFWSAPKAPTSSKEGTDACLVHLPYFVGRYAIQWHRGPEEAIDTFLGSRAEPHYFTPYHVPIARRKYRARIELSASEARVFMDGGLVASSPRPSLAAAANLPMFLGLRQHGGGAPALKVHALRIHQLDVPGGPQAGKPKTSAPIAPLPSGDPARAAATWLLERGAMLDVEAGKQKINARHVNMLPSEAFRITSIEASQCPALNDAALAQLAPGLTELEQLGGNSVRFTGTGFAAWQSHKRLRKLSCVGAQGSAVTDAGLEQMAGLTSLQELNITSDDVTDAGIAHLSKLGNLLSLEVTRGKLTDAAVVPLQKCPKLTTLRFYQSPLGDDALASLAKMPLQSLVMLAPKVTDAGIAHLAQCRTLQLLNLGTTQVTDKGIEALHGLRDLRTLRLGKTGVTAAGVERLRKALPSCNVQH